MERALEQPKCADFIFRVQRLDFRTWEYNMAVSEYIAGIGKHFKIRIFKNVFPSLGTASRIRPGDLARAEP